MPEATLLGWLLIGLVAGVLGRLLMPGRDPGGILVTILIGIAGALLAGFVAQAAGVAIVGRWAAYGAAAIGAIGLLAAYRLFIAARLR